MTVELEGIAVCIECSRLDKSRYLSPLGYKHLCGILGKRGRDIPTETNIGLFFESRSGVMVPWLNPHTGHTDAIVERYFAQKEKHKT